MRYLVGIILLSIAVLHAWHIVGIDYGSVSVINGSRFFSFSALDRLASSGVMGKFLVLSIDGGIALLGVLEFRGRSR